MSSPQRRSRAPLSGAAQRGSGKSNTIAWLAHQLTTLYTTPPAGSSEERLFHSIIIITDRRVLDRQLQQTVSQFPAPDGLIQVINESSQQLLQALAAGKQIIVTTLQKFPVVVRYLSDPDSLPEGTRYALHANTINLRGKRFALIIDEAHSSQSGEQMRAVREALRTELNLTVPATSPDHPAAPDAPDDPDDPDDPDAPPTLDSETLIAEMIRQRGKQPHISIFAFTATPKTKTLELFGKCMPDGAYQAHSLYTMRQAIEEGFILDVLAHYTTYRSLWRLHKTIADDPRYDTRKASALLAAFVHDHPTAIDQKAQIIVEHLRASVVGQIGGQARAMLVTSSRRQAVRYKLAIDAYLAAQGYPERAIIAFSGEVRDGGQSYTEAGMNGFSDSETPQRIKSDPYRLLIVANKYQTGYDEPLLHTMYVDKKLGGVNAVQTLSRLNRIAPGKCDPQVIDFVNDVDTIRNAFEPYYTTTILSEGTDPNLLFEMQTALDASHIYTPAEITAVTDVLFTAAPAVAAARIPSLLQPAVARYQQHAADVQQEFRKTLDRFVRLYAFVTQISSFPAPELERLYQYGRLLLRHLPATGAGVPTDIYQHVALASYETRKVRSGAIQLDPEVTPLTPPHGGVGSSEPLLSTKDPLSEIIAHLNQQFGVNLNGAAIASLQHVREQMGSDAAVAAAFRANPPNVAREVFDERVGELIEGFIDDNVRLYEHIKRNPELAQQLREALFRLFLDDTGGAGAPPAE
ncbi:MAG: type I restriction endonuclease subunit R [Chloroflexaceae bacterium]|nr:type I restriction endonuclease subunit R [Chloroflexaceae bacterium]